MNQQFNFFGSPEYPDITLCNPNTEELFSMGLAYDTNLTLRFNDLSEFRFNFPQSIDSGQTTIEAYSFLQNKRLILLEGYGYFIIVDCPENLDGAIPTKSVTCQSLQSELIQKTVAAYGGTKKLWDILDSSNTVLQDMLDRAPNWSAGDIDTDLLLKYRTFNVSNSNVYNFLMNDVAKAFECVFIFDTATRTISVYSIDNATSETDIFLSFDNLLTEANFSEKSDEINTCLAVYGGGTLNIRLVNPLGTDKIYNFDYYKNTDWMTQGLVDAITAWDALVDSIQLTYASDLLILETYNAELLVLEQTLVTLNEELSVLEGVQAVRIEQGLAYDDITAEMVAKQAEIDAQQVLIDNKNTQISDITLVLEGIHNDVSFENNFTPDQLLELDNFIYQNTYKNENIIETDSMTLVEVQQQAQALYDQAQTVLVKVSQPRYELSFNSVNYINLQEFSIFTDQTELGCVVTCDLGDETYIQVIMLELSMTFDSPTDFSMKFSNRVRLDDGKFTYADLMGAVVRTGASVTFDSLKWSNWENNYKNDVTTFITSSLDATTNNLISNTDQEILINQNGLRARRTDGSGGYKLEQAWLVNNVLAFSDDGFLTSKLALGKINLPAGGTAYGVVGDQIIGKILAGNTLTITNDNNNFLLDENGAVLNNAKFSIQTTNTKIVIDPTADKALTIQKNQGGTFVDKFWVDNTGNVNFAGTLSGANGTFSGTVTATTGLIGTLVIDSQGLKTADGVNYLRGNGNLKWGGLTITGSSATFTGTIYADKLVGQVVDSQVASGLNAGKVTNGSMSGTRVSGGIIGAAGGGSIKLNDSGFVTVNSDSIVLDAGTATLTLTNLVAQMNGSGGARINLNSGVITMSGLIHVDGGTGLSGTYTVSTPSGTHYFTYSRGVLVGYS